MIILMRNYLVDNTGTINSLYPASGLHFVLSSDVLLSVYVFPVCAGAAVCVCVLWGVICTMGHPALLIHLCVLHMLPLLVMLSQEVIHGLLNILNYSFHLYNGNYPSH